MIKAVVFDLDNTLYDYDLCNEIAEETLLREMSAVFHIDVNESRNLLSNAKKNVKKQLGEDVAASHNRLLYMQNICEQMEKPSTKYAMHFYNCYWDKMLEEMQLYPYVLPLVKELHEQGCKVALLTDLTAHIQYRKLERLGLSDCIDYIVTSEEAGAEKPSGKMFELTLSKLGMRGEEVIMVGDSLKKDVVGAESCGIKGILFEKHTDIYSLVIDEIERAGS